jgi:hypothetical protein
LDSQPSNSGPVTCSRWYASSSVPVTLDPIISVLQKNSLSADRQVAMAFTTRLAGSF